MFLKILINKMKRFFNFKLLTSNLSRGMTLIELLVVITIIGVLSTIILSSVSDSRARAYDSKIKQQLSSFRTAAEIYFQNQVPNTYNVSSSCSSGMFVSILPSEGSPGLYIDIASMPANTEVVCGSNANSYAVKATLYSGSEYWCVDNSGDSVKIPGSIGASVTACP